MTENPVVIDDLSPAEVAAKTVNIGIKKANLDFWTMFFLALFGGAYIALGAILATTVAANGPEFPFGVNSLHSPRFRCYDQPDERRLRKRKFHLRDRFKHDRAASCFRGKNAPGCLATRRQTSSG